MENEKIQVVNISDRYGDECVKDSFNKPNGERVKPTGYVEIYDMKSKEEKQLVGKHNLVVYQGREWIAERIFNLENASTTTDKDEFISWFGVGDGGADVTNDPLTPYNPVSGNTNLGSEVGLGTGTDAAAQYADFRTGNYFKHPFDSVIFEQDVDNNNEWLVVRITTTLDSQDSNGEFINEAGLFTSTSKTAGHTGPFNLFSRVTFPTLVKNSDRQLMFIWYVYL